MSEPVGNGGPGFRGEALVLSAGLRDQLAGHAESAYPLEACGALFGIPVGSELPIITRAIPLRNSNRKADNGYQISIGVLSQLSLEDRTSEERLVGIYHSHPDRAASPSELDLRMGVPGLVYVTVSVRSGRAGARLAWIAGPTESVDFDYPSGEGACQS